MARSRPNPNRLLVEGAEDKRIIPYFMNNFVTWGNEPEDWPVHIESFNGVEGMLKPGVIEAELKTPGLKALGVLVDANSDVDARWRRIRERALRAFPTIPEQLPFEGLVCQNVDGVRFGVWLMPDNRLRGMMETFLSLFIPVTDAPLWAMVQQHCRDAKNHCQAPYVDAHADKAYIHAWLALQDPPGQSLHLAIITKTLQPTSPHADPFVKWFRELFAL